MYWLISILIIIVMIAVLAVADTTAAFDVAHYNNLSDHAILPLLFILASVLIVIAQRQAISVDKATHNKSSAQTPFQSKSQPLLLLSQLSRHFIVVLLALGLIFGSALNTLDRYQLAESSEINTTIRVQALVTIEGISDSVFDAATGSSYRQVATINHISPLVAEMTAQNLDTISVDYTTNLNSLSDKSATKHLDNISNNAAVKNSAYRVLLTQYPKKSSNKKLEDSPTSILNELQPGDQIFMTLTLTPLATSEQAINNPTGFDSYRWLRSRHIDGVANIISTSTSTLHMSDTADLALSSDSTLERLRTRINQWRWQLRQHLYHDWGSQTLAEQQADAVTLSLLTGDRSLINRDTKDLYQLAGISHLLAISGTHVLFLAIMLAAIAVFFFDRKCPKLYRYLPRWQLRWWVMISAAFIYALFTGFDVPAARTAWMLLAIGLVRLLLLPISTMRVLLALAVIMAWFDPYVLWQAGYWLSFVAVALLLKYEGSSQHQSVISVQNQPLKNSTIINKVWMSRIGQIFKNIFKLQCWLFIALLPITLLLFGKASLWGLVINLFAIGLFGWIIVPLNLLAGICFIISPAAADVVWTVVSCIVGYLHELLSWLTGWSALNSAWLYTPVNTGMLLIALFVYLPWLLPRGVVSRWLALPPLTLLVMTIYANQQIVSMTPTLYILPTGDDYLSATVLQYPINNDEGLDHKRSTNHSVSWLFLADHRAKDQRVKPSSLTADQLSASLEQQLRTLSIKRLDGVVIQTGVVALTDTLISEQNSNKTNSDYSAQLPMAVLRLNQHLPISQYWQAGRSDQWSTLQKEYKEAMASKNMTTISAQNCDQGKKWQLGEGSLTVEAVTGWSKIGDTSVWDCGIAIHSRSAINVLKYNATNPMQPLALDSQKLKASLSLLSENIKTASATGDKMSSSIILDAATHQRVWQLWSLLCTVDPVSNVAKNASTIWLGHSASTITIGQLTNQSIDKVITLDDAPLEVALAITESTD